MNIKQALLLGLIVIALAGRAAGEETAKLPGDAEMRQMVVGTWAYMGTSATNVVKVKNEAYIFGGKGELTKELTVNIKGKEAKLSSTGRWEVKNGMLVTTVTRTINASGEAKDTKRPIVSHMKIISINDHELVVRTEIAQSLMTLKR